MPSRDETNARNRANTDRTHQRRFVAHTGERHSLARSLRADHPAVTEGRTLFPTRVFHASELQRVLKSGHNSRKTGRIVTKGRWRGMPIYTLTLEERATCPRTCEQWQSCYGSNMHFAERIRADEEFEVHLWIELRALQVAHPAGFVVRLHILGDFYSTRYARLWIAALDEFPALRVFGYTARRPTSLIGEILRDVAAARWDRFAIRFSGAGDAAAATEVVDTAGEAQGVICPAQTSHTDCCATCGLCWQTRRLITFLRH